MKLTSIKNLSAVAIDVKNLNTIKGGTSWGDLNGGGSRPTRPTTMSVFTW